MWPERFGQARRGNGQPGACEVGEYQSWEARQVGRGAVAQHRDWAQQPDISTGSGHGVTVPLPSLRNGRQPVTRKMFHEAEYELVVLLKT